MFKEDYESPELLLSILKENGLEESQVYKDSMEKYEQEKEKEIAYVNKRIDKVNDIIKHLDSPKKVSMFLFGMTGIVDDVGTFIGKALLLLNDELLDHLHKDFAKLEDK
jgi:hypothetical protein